MTATSDWDTLFDELYLKTYAALQAGEDPAPLALGAVRLAGCPDGGDVLDAACGYGRHSLVLAAEGYRVVGLDRSPVLLDQARRSSGGAEWPRWVQGDYRALPFEDGSFDAVLNLFSSFGFWGEEGDRQTMREFARVLRPGRRLLLEAMHRDRLVRIFQPRAWNELPGGALLFEERTFDSVSGVTRTLHALVDQDGRRQSTSYEFRVYTATELVVLAKAAGFAAVECYGDVDRTPVSADTRLLLVAEAPS